MKKRVMITGSSGFIGFHLGSLLLKKGYQILGVDAMTPYYDPKLKFDRLSILKKYTNFSQEEFSIEDKGMLIEVSKKFCPDFIIHLAAQAGVRYSLENPQAYIDTNILGTFNVMEVAKDLGVKHLLMASTSSVYGANTVMPFKEEDKTDTPLTIYAATKKANEVMAHAYSHLYDIPTTMFRFFTVYGPWGRPDMALFKFTENILRGMPIEIYNNGNMYRDFTYVEDLVMGIEGLLRSVPILKSVPREVVEKELTPIAPYRVVNIGNSNKVKLLDFIQAIEEALGVKAKRQYLAMQQGDVPATWADSTLIKQLTDFQPNTNIRDGVQHFVDWYKAYYEIK